MTAYQKAMAERINVEPGFPAPPKKPFYGEFWVVGAWWLSIQLRSTSAALPKLTRKPQKKEAPVCEALKKKPQTQNWQRVEVLPEGFCKPFGAVFYALS